MAQYITEDTIQKNIRYLKIPLLISWALTHRCSQHCLYCKIWKLHCSELNTKQAIFTIEQLSVLGTILICFSGGEPLLREDIGDILDYTYKKGILFDISSNGLLVKQKIRQIKNARLLCLSLDGPPGIHDKIRGNGSYVKVIEAATLAQKENITVYFRTVLSKTNLDSIDYILNLSRIMNIKVIFQPTTRVYYGNGDENNFMPAIRAYRNIIDRLIKEKEKGNQYIQNPLAVLKYLKKWPISAPMSCVSGKIFFHISPNGKISSCIWGKDPKYVKGRSCLALGLAKAIELTSEEKCEGCWDAAACNFNFSFFSASKNIKEGIEDTRLY